MTNYFSNTIKINAPAGKILAILQQPLLINTWTNGAVQVKTTDREGTFSVHRDGDALNTDELLTIVSEASGVTYVSREGELEYELRFTVEASADHQSTLSETLQLQAGQAHLPLTLLRPIAQNAFKRNLDALGKYAELTN
jgi:hypothetical protein